jgi:hypothetical protein
VETQKESYVQTEQQRKTSTEDVAPSDQQQNQQSADYGSSRREFEPMGQREQTQPMGQGISQDDGTLMGGQEMQKFSSQWNSIQAAFVDEPRKAVEQADKLVAEVIEHMSTTFANERKNLEGQWSRGDQVSTEDLRVALQRYRQFFQSLLRT